MLSQLAHSWQCAYLLATCLCWCVQRYIAGLLLVSAAFAAVLSAQPHPYSADFPKRILLQHVVRMDEATQVYLQFLSSLEAHQCISLEFRMTELP